MSDTLWLGGGAGVTANERIEGRDEFLTFHYSGRNENTVFNYATKQVAAEDKSYLILKTPVTLTKAEVEALGQSVIAPGGGLNDVVIGVLEMDSQASGKVKLKTPLVTFHHDSGETAPAIAAPTIADNGYEWIVPADGSSTILGFQYVGDNATHSAYLKVQGYEKQTKLSKTDGALELTPDLSSGGAGLGVYSVRSGALMKVISHKEDIIKGGGSNWTYKSIERTEQWWPIARVDMDTASFVPGSINSSLTTFGITIKGRIVLKGGGTDRVIESFLSRPKIFASDFINDIKVGGGGLKFKVKMALDNLTYIDYPDDVNWSQREIYGHWEEAYNSVYPDRRDDEIIDHIDINFKKDDIDFVRELRIDELWIMSGGSEPQPLKKLTPDENGFYTLLDLDETDTFPYDKNNTTKVSSSTYSHLKVTRGNICVVRSNKYYTEMLFDLDSQDQTVTGTEYVVSMGLSDIPAAANALLVPKVEFNNINPTVRDVMLVSRADDGSPQRTAIGTNVNVNLSGKKFTSLTEYNSYADGVVGNMPTLPLANRRNVGYTWHHGEDSIQLFDGEILGMVPSSLPYAVSDATNYSRYVTAHLPYKNG